MITLREMLPLLRTGNVTILNEINEPLVFLAYLPECIIPATKALNPSLLDRNVLASWADGETTVVIKIEGEEDAE